MKIPNRLNGRGFSLVELLVVILIISILLTLGSVAFRSTGGKGVTSAMASTEAIFDEARSVAMGRAALARVMVDVDDSHDRTYLRRMFIVAQDLDENGDPIEDAWELVGRGYTFPDGVYFSQKYSKKNHSASSGRLDEMLLSGDGISALYEGRYAYYEFNAEGICTTGLPSGGTGDSQNYLEPSFVIGSGVLPKDDTEPRLTGEGRRDLGGFVIWRNGATSIFRSPEQAGDDGSSKTF